jgi:hypothetical protein
MRKGMMVGTGKRGYHNVVGRDPAVHSQSAKGLKQPQNVNVFTPKFFNETASLFNKRTTPNSQDNLYTEDDMIFIGKLRREGISRDEAEKRLYERNKKSKLRLIGHEENQDIYEDKKGNIYKYSGSSEAEYQAFLKNPTKPKTSLVFFRDNNGIKRWRHSSTKGAIWGKEKPKKVNTNYEELDKEQRKMVEHIDKEKYGNYLIGDLRQTMSKYQDKTNWKKPFTAIVKTPEEADKLVSAVRFFQADEPTIQKITVPVRHKDGLVYMLGTAYEVKSKGYQAW